MSQVRTTLSTRPYRTRASAAMEGSTADTTPIRLRSARSVHSSTLLHIYRLLSSRHCAQCVDLMLIVKTFEGWKYYVLGDRLVDVRRSGIGVHWGGPFGHPQTALIDSVSSSSLHSIIYRTTSSCKMCDHPGDSIWVSKAFFHKKYGAAYEQIFLASLLLLRFLS